MELAQKGRDGSIDGSKVSRYDGSEKIRERKTRGEEGGGGPFLTERERGARSSQLLELLGGCYNNCLLLWA
jgi:hypothetical protein